MERGVVFDRRTYQREYARRRYEQRLAERRRGLGTCPRQFGRWGVCGGVLETTVLRNGATVTTCPRCDRFTAGLCRDCSSQVDGTVRRARFCAFHAILERHRHIVKYRTNNRALVRRRAKLAARESRQRNSDYKRLWRAAYPEKVAAQKRRYFLRQPQTAYAYAREYHKTHRAHFEEVRFCLGGCGRQVFGRTKKCRACKEAIRASALRMMGKRAA